MNPAMQSMTLIMKSLVKVNDSRSLSIHGKYSSWGWQYLMNSFISRIARIPDTSKVRQKMLYASSKDALRKKLVGLAIEIQGTDFSEVSYEVVLDKASRSA